MSRITVKELELRIEKLEAMVEKLLKRLSYKEENPYERKTCPCCGQKITPYKYKNIYDHVRWSGI